MLKVSPPRGRLTAVDVAGFDSQMVHQKSLGSSVEEQAAGKAITSLRPQAGVATGLRRSDGVMPGAFSRKRMTAVDGSRVQLPPEGPKLSCVPFRTAVCKTVGKK